MLGSQSIYGDIHFLRNSTELAGQGQLCDKISTSSSEFLPSAQRYYVYRILLYTDEFKPFSSFLSQGSAGGVHMLPLSLPASWRNTRAAIRLSSLAESGVSSNEILLSIIDDIVSTTVQGVTTRDSNCEEVVVLLDVVGFVPDYVEVSKVLDCMGHNTNVPCSHCTFVRKVRHDSAAYGCTTSISAEDYANLRTWERHEALRESNISKEHATRLGMNHLLEVSDSSAPLRKLREA